MKTVIVWATIQIIFCFVAKMNAQDAPDAPSKDMYATNTQDVVDSFVRAVGAIEDKFPELHGFTQSIQDRKDKSTVSFRCGVKRGRGKSNTIEKNGIDLLFQVFPDNTAMQLSGNGISRHLTNLHVMVYGIIFLSDTPSEGLLDSLQKTIRRHVGMLEVLDGRTANKTSETIGTEAAPQSQR